MNELIKLSMMFFRCLEFKKKNRLKTQFLDRKNSYLIFSATIVNENKQYQMTRHMTYFLFKKIMVDDMLIKINKLRVQGCEPTLTNPCARPYMMSP